MPEEILDVLLDTAVFVLFVISFITGFPPLAAQIYPTIFGEPVVGFIVFLIAVFSAVFLLKRWGFIDEHNS